MANLFRGLQSAAKNLYLVIFPFHAAAWKTSTNSVHYILNEPDLHKQDELASVWRDSIQAQLTVIAGALVTSVTASAFTWPATASTSWTVPAIWYASMLLSLTAISSATQQALAIHRLNSLPDGVRNICNLLSSNERGETGAVKARIWQLYIWQIPILMLNLSIYFSVADIAVLVWEASRREKYRVGSDEVKIVIAFMVALGLCVMHYVISTVGIYDRVRKDVL